MPNGATTAMGVLIQTATVRNTEIATMATIALRMLALATAAEGAG
jgi:hypothetical protein